MELFSITCTTCNSKLKVRSRAAIGQILACPKCNSMVMVEAPEGWTGDKVTEEREPAAATKQGAAASGNDSESALDETFDDAVAMLSGSAPSLPTSDSEIKRAAASSAVRNEPADTPPTESTQKAELPAAASSESLKVRLMIAAAITGGVLLIAVVGFALFGPSGGDETAAADEAAEQHVDPAPDDPPVSKATDDKTEEVDPATKDPVAVEPAKDPTDTDPRDTDPPDDDRDPSDPVKPEGDPPGFETDDPLDDERTDAKSLLDDLRSIGELIGDEPLIDDPGPIVPPKPDEEPLPRPAPRTVDVAKQLGVSVTGIDFEGIGITDYLQFVSDMSTIPITVEPEALLRASLSPDDRINVQQTATTVAGILQAALKPHGLAIQPREGHLWVTTLPDVGGAELSKVEYPVDDLVQSADDLKQLRDWITTLVAPKSWTSAGGPGSALASGKSLIVEQSGDVQFDVLTLCEKLRIARGSSPRMITDPSRLGVETRVVSARKKLATPISLNFVRPTRFVSVVRRIGQAANVHLLIDWEAIAKAGWNPDAELTFSVEEQPLDETLNRLLHRMDLTYRVVNDSIMQITTPLALMEQAELEFYSIADLVDEELNDEHLINLLKSTLGEVFFFDNAGAIHYDAKSKSLLVALPQPQQMALAKLLTRLRADK